MREPAQGQIIAGKYRLESLIGHGGMGSVWRARHESLDMPVAVKFMGAHAGGDPEARRRFDREARALASLRTPSIVQVLDHGVDDDTPYIVMELLEGEDLSTRMARARRIPLDETSRILAQVARALRRAHESGVTHRDLKPSNIFLAQVDGEEIVKVLDFGVAKLAAVGALGDQLTKTGTLLGSPGYMSPEQARGKEVDFRSDLWALAVIVFRAVTGAKPFAGDSIAELVIKLCIDPRPVATRIAGDLPPSIDRFFEKAFAAEPQDRFQSAVEMASAFAQAIGQPGPDLSRSGPSPITRTMVSRVEPTPASGSFGGFAKATAETGSLAPAAPPPASSPRASHPGGLDPATSSFPIGTHLPAFPASATSSSPSFVAPGSAPSIATMLSSQGSNPASPPSFSPSHAAPPDPRATSPSANAHGPRVDLKVLLFAAAGAAVLAIFFALAIAGLRRRHAGASYPNEDAPIATATLTAPSTESAPTAATAIVPSDPAASAPAPSAEPSSAPAAPGAGPTIVEAPVQGAPTTAAAATPAPKPSPTARPAPTTKPSGKTAPTGSGKKKGSKPNFGY